jgi:hypothetical protein
MEAPVVVLALIGVLLLVPALLRLRVERLRLGSTVLALSRPIDFSRPGPAVVSLIVAIACLAGAGLLFGLSGSGFSPLAYSRAGKQPTPLAPEDIGFVQVDSETGRVTVRLLEPDTMAGWTVAEQSGNFQASVSAESLLGPLNAVACLAFRVTGTELKAGESYRASGTRDWPESGYLFCVSHLGQWAFSRFDHGVPTYLKPYQNSNVIRQTKANVLAVNAEGSTMQLLVNDQEVAQVTDPSYTSGRIQVTCGTPKDQIPAAVCHFESVDVKPLP